MSATILVWSKDVVVFDCDLNNVTVNEDFRKRPIRVQNMYSIQFSPDGRKCRVSARFGQLETAMQHLESAVE